MKCEIEVHGRHRAFALACCDLISMSIRSTTLAVRCDCCPPFVQVFHKPLPMMRLWAVWALLSCLQKYHCRLVIFAQKCVVWLLIYFSLRCDTHWFWVKIFLCYKHNQKEWKWEQRRECLSMCGFGVQKSWTWSDNCCGFPF